METKHQVVELSTWVLSIIFCMQVRQSSKQPILPAIFELSLASLSCSLRKQSTHLLLDSSISLRKQRDQRSHFNWITHYLYRCLDFYQFIRLSASSNRFYTLLFFVGLLFLAWMPPKHVYISSSWLVIHKPSSPGSGPYGIYYTRIYFTSMDCGS